MATAADGLRLLLEELERSAQSESAKKEFRELILKRLYEAMTEPEQRVHFARHLLSLKVERSLIRERLQTKFKIGRTQAYRDIEEALQIVP